MAKKQLIDLDALMDTLSTAEAKNKEKENANTGDENFLSLKKGNTYLVRFLPNKEDRLNTFLAYDEYGFKSVTGSGYIYAGRTPSSVGRKDIVRDLQWKTYSSAKESGDKAEMERSYQLFPQKKQMVNVFVVNDPVNPDNNGKVKILRYSAKVNKAGEPTSPLYGKIHDSIFGSERADIGKRAFDLTGDGVTFAIKVEENQGGWNDYSKSSFKFPSDIGLSDSEILEAMDSTYDLEKFLPEVKSDEDLKALFDEHWYGEASPRTQSYKESSLSTSNSSEDDDIPFDHPKTSTVKELDDDMDSFLDDLDK